MIESTLSKGIAPSASPDDTICARSRQENLVDLDRPEDQKGTEPSQPANPLEGVLQGESASLYSLNTTLPRRNWPSSEPDFPPPTPLLVYFKLTGDVLFTLLLFLLYIGTKVRRLSTGHGLYFDLMDLGSFIGMLLILAIVRYIKSRDLRWTKWFFSIDYSPDLFFSMIMFFVIGSGGIVQLMLSHQELDLFDYIAEIIQKITHSTTLGSTIAVWVVSSFGMVAMIALFVIFARPLGYIRRKRAPLIWTATYLESYTGLGEPSYAPMLLAVYIGCGVIAAVLEFWARDFEWWIRKHIRGYEQDQ